jgi:hypothetical protein
VYVASIVTRFLYFSMKELFMMIRVCADAVDANEARRTRVIARN